YGAPGQLLIGLGHVRLRADGDGTDVLAYKADLVHHDLPGVALGEVDQRPGQGVGFVWADVHEQPAGEGIVFGGDQFRCGQHGLRVTGRYRNGPGRSDTGQADEADGADIPPDREGQLAGGGVALCAGRQLELARAEYHVAEGFPGAGVAIAGMDMDRAGQAAQLAPVGDLAGEHLGYLIQIQGLDGVVRMDYYRDAVQTYDLFRIGPEHVPGGGEVSGFGLADGAGGGTYLRRSVLHPLNAVPEPWAWMRTSMLWPSTLTAVILCSRVVWLRSARISLAPLASSMPSTSRGASSAPMVLEPLICRCRSAARVGALRMIRPASSRRLTRAERSEEKTDISMAPVMKQRGDLITRV